MTEFGLNSNLDGRFNAMGPLTEEEEIKMMVLNIPRDNYLFRCILLAQGFLESPSVFDTFCIRAPFATDIESLQGKSILFTPET